MAPTRPVLARQTHHIHCVAQHASCTRQRRRMMCRPPPTCTPYRGGAIAGCEVSGKRPCASTNGATSADGHMRSASHPEARRRPSARSLADSAEPSFHRLGHVVARKKVVKVVHHLHATRDTLLSCTNTQGALRWACGAPHGCCPQRMKTRQHRGRAQRRPSARAACRLVAGSLAAWPRE